jgi:hypothetical protein
MACTSKSCPGRLENGPLEPNPEADVWFSLPNGVVAEAEPIKRERTEVFGQHMALFY